MVQRPGGGGNVGFFAGEDSVLLVDSLFAPLADRLLTAVRSVSAGEIRFLINTHVHPDHIGGNEPLAGRDVLIFAHGNVRVRALERLRFSRRPLTPTAIRSSTSRTRTCCTSGTSSGPPAIR